MRKVYAAYYQLITHNVRITRELNNIHLETEGRNDSPAASVPDEETAVLIHSSAQLFAASIEAIQALSGKPVKEDLVFNLSAQLPSLNAAQKLYLSRLHTELQLMMQNLRTLTGMPVAEVLLSA